jgi:hypothetical protein
VGAEPGLRSPDALRPVGLLCTAWFSSPRHLQRRSTSNEVRDLCSEGGKYGRGNGRFNLAYKYDFHGKCTDLLHAAKLRHGTDGFTSPPKEGMLRIFVVRKMRRLQPGLNTRTCVPEASMLTTRTLKPL